MHLISEFYRRVFGSFGGLIPTIFLFFCVAILGELLYFFVIAKKRRAQGLPGGIKYLALRYLFYIYLMFVYRQTGIRGVFWSGQVINPDRIYLIPFTTSPDPTPYYLNILMTIPLGLLLPFIWPSMRKWWKVLLAGFMFSFGIEFTQLFTNRVTSTSDLITNTTGAMIGYLIFVVVFSWAMRNNGNLTTKTDSKLINNEAILYLILSFIGAVILNHPFIRMLLP